MCVGIHSTHPRRGKRERSQPTHPPTYPTQRAHIDKLSPYVVYKWPTHPKETQPNPTPSSTHPPTHPPTHSTACPHRQTLPLRGLQMAHPQKTQARALLQGRREQGLQNQELRVRPTHPPNPQITVTHSNRLVLLHLLNHPPTQPSDHSNSFQPPRSPPSSQPPTHPTLRSQ